MTKAFLHAGEDSLVIACLDIDHPVGLQTGLSASGRKEVRTGDAPEDFPTGAGGYSSAEQSRGGTVDRTVPATGNFM